MKPQSCLLLMMGLPRSGKSTEANRIHKTTGAPIVCPDDIRLALHGQAFVPEAEDVVWTHARLQARALARRHPLVIVDATNTTRSRRDEWLRGPWRMRAVRHVSTPLHICLNRTDDPEMHKVIERMYERWEAVEESEGLWGWVDVQAHYIGGGVA